MSKLFLLTEEPREHLRPSFPKRHGRQRVDERRVMIGIILMNCNGLRCRDAPISYSPLKTL